MKIHESIPLLKASIPKLPLPANKSTASPPSKYGPIILKMDSFTLSVVGLVFEPGTAFIGNPLQIPEITLKYGSSLEKS